MSRPPRPFAALAALALIALLGASGCGGDGGEEAVAAPDYASALAGAPAPLAELYAQADELLPGGEVAYEERIASLRGFPVVANVWASWCGPCREEFPDFQRLSARYGTRVAFLGVNSQDVDDAAATFLRDHPVPYPSYTDPDEEIADALGSLGLPGTAFYDREGELVFFKQGEYSDESELEADIRRYALAEGG